MPYAHTDALVETEWLAGALGSPGFSLVDGSWYLPNSGRDPRADFERRHIPGAVFFDIDGIKDRASALPHMLPSPEDFADAVGRLGIGNADRVIVYDGMGLMSAARVWWTFRAFGHDNVAILNGGLAKWKVEGRPLAEGAATPAPARFTARFRPALVRAKPDMIANLGSRREQVLDARSAGRFKGTEPEPRAGLRGGHIPGSHNLPYDRLTDPATRTVVAPDRLGALYAEAGIDVARPVVTTCGSGITAAALAFGLYLAGASDVAVYDGSWTEWGGSPETPVETG